MLCDSGKLKELDTLTGPLWGSLQEDMKSCGLAMRDWESNGQRQLRARSWLTDVHVETGRVCMCECQSYPMSRPCRGKLLLICNDEFDSPSTTDCDQQQRQQQLSERLGADADVHNVTTLFKRLQFDVIYHSNLTAAVSTCSHLIDFIVQFSSDFIRESGIFITCCIN